MSFSKLGTTGAFMPVFSKVPVADQRGGNLSHFLSDDFKMSIRLLVLSIFLFYFSLNQNYHSKKSETQHMPSSSSLAVCTQGTESLLYASFL